MAASTAQTIEKMEIRKNYRNVWHTDLMSTMQTDPCYCCLSIWCSPCVSYLLRKRALYDDMSRYVCCAGYMPCSGKCGESNCPEVCLCTEVLCCFGNSVASTRFLLQDEFNIQTTQCDNFIIAFMLCLQQLACICSLIACILGSDELSDAAEILRCLSDLVYCTVCACMQTQHKVEMDKRDGMFGPGPMAIPPIQQMSRIDQPIPPAVGYPPQQSYGGAYGYQPQPSPYAQGNLPPPVYDQYGQGHQLAGYPPPAYDQYGQAHPPAGYPLPVHDQNPLAYPPPAHDQSTYPPPPPGTYPPPPPPGAYPPPGKQPPPPPPPGY